MAMFRTLIICTLLLAHAMASAVVSGGAVLCIHPDGRALVESPLQQSECHDLTSQTAPGAISDLPCNDIAMATDVLGKHFASVRICFNHLFQLSPVPISACAADLGLPASARVYHSSIDSLLPPDGVLSLLATVVLTV